MKLSPWRSVPVISLIGFVLPITGISNAYALPGQSTFSVAASPLWTDTGIHLTAGETVSFTASGTWDFGLGSVSPAGIPYYQAWDRFLAGINQGQLLGYVGSDPFQAHWGDGSFFPQASGYWAIGNGGQFTSSVTGELWLGINDDAVSEAAYDNTGAITVQMAVVPEPASCLLLGLGLCGLSYSGRRQQS